MEEVTRDVEAGFQQDSDIRHEPFGQTFEQTSVRGGAGGLSGRSAIAFRANGMSTSPSLKNSANMSEQFLDFSMDLLIGEDVSTVNKDSSKLDAESFIAECDQAQLQVVRLMRPWLVRWWNGWTKVKNHPFDTTQGFVDRYVQSAAKDFEAPGSGPISRSPALLDETIREVGTQDQVFIRNQILNVFMPGRDSVAIMASHIFFRLARSPVVYEKVRKEVLAAGLDRLSCDTLKDLTYINAVVNETLRLGGE